MRRTSLVLAGCFASFCAWGACDKPTDIAPQSVVQVPDYAASPADAAPDPEETAMQTAWGTYQDSVFDALSHSANPRDWALATLTAKLPFDARSSNDAREDDLVERARRAAPDDVLVQWIAARQGSKDTHAAAAHTLQQLESDNAAVWLESLVAAMQRKDDAAVDVALAKMSSSGRFDEHSGDLMKILAEVYLTHPMPDELRALAAKEDESISKDAIAFTSALAVTAAISSPHLSQLFDACRVNPATGKNASHAADCAAIGRLMIARSDTVLANRIGYSLLRVSQTFTGDDLRASRSDDWVYSRFLRGLSAEQESPDEIVAYQRDWIETNDELEAMRRRVVRAGKTVTPPDDWVDDSSPFSAERLRGDAPRRENSAQK